MPSSIKFLTSSTTACLAYDIIINGLALDDTQETLTTFDVPTRVTTSCKVKNWVEDVTKKAMAAFDLTAPSPREGMDTDRAHFGASSGADHRDQVPWQEHVERLAVNACTCPFYYDMLSSSKAYVAKLTQPTNA